MIGILEFYDVLILGNCYYYCYIIVLLLGGVILVKKLSIG